MSIKNRIGIDLGGTKISGALLDPSGQIQKRIRLDTPRDDYSGTLREIVSLARELKGDEPDQPTIGIGIPGSISPKSGRIQNANSTWLNGMPFKADLEKALELPVRVANDANCFAISEAIDGAGAAFHSIFGVILGTGCGGGFVFGRQIVNGPRAIGGEWGHTPLPAPEPDELPGPVCWCGRQGCIETWVSGPALEADHARHFGGKLSAAEITTNASKGCAECSASIGKYVSRLARGLAVVTNILDPDCIVLGGGLSNMDQLYSQLPGAIAPHIFSELQEVRILPPKYGDDSGVRGAAWLWGGPGDVTRNNQPD